MKLQLSIDGKAFAIELAHAGKGRYKVAVDGDVIDLRHEPNTDHLHVEADGRRHRVKLVDDRKAAFDGDIHEFELDAGVGVGAAAKDGAVSARVKPPMTGRLVSLAVKVGQAVTKGDVLFVLEAMKMQNEVRSPITGNIIAIHAAPGSALETGHVVMEIGPGA